MAFGISFGKKKQSAQGTATLDKESELFGSQQQTSTQQGTTTTDTTGRTSGTTTQQGAQQQTQDSRNIGSTTGRQTGTTTSLDSGVQDALADRIRSVLAGGVTDENIMNLSRQIGGLGDFDADSFVSGIVGQARNRGEQLLQEQNSSFAANAGGTADTNTMAALMAQRGSADLSANLAGIEAQARAQAAGIQQQGVATAVGAQTGLAGIADSLANALKGGTTTTDMTSLTDEISQLIGRGGTISTQTGTSDETQRQSSQTDQLLTQIADILTQQSQRERGTETQQQSGKSGGFGLSLGF